MAHLADDAHQPLAGDDRAAETDPVVGAHIDGKGAEPVVGGAPHHRGGLKEKVGVALLDLQQFTELLVFHLHRFVVDQLLPQVLDLRPQGPVFLRHLAGGEEGAEPLLDGVAHRDTEAVEGHHQKPPRAGEEGHDAPGVDGPEEEGEKHGPHHHQHPEAGGFEEVFQGGGTSFPKGHLPHTKSARPSGGHNFLSEPKNPYPQPNDTSP